MFNDNQFTRRDDSNTPQDNRLSPRGPVLAQYLSPSQTLNGMRGRWLGNNNAPVRPPVTEQRQGRGGRPPVFTPEARPLQENAGRAAQRHRPQSSDKKVGGRFSDNNFFSTVSSRRTRGN